MKTLRISVVEYLNTAPLVWGFTDGPFRGKYDLSFTVPAKCAEALRTGQADVAILPAIEYARIPDLEILPDLSISSKHSVRSLLLIAKKPLAEVRTLALDGSSRSTQALTRILADARWRIAPQFLELPPDLPAMLERADAALLIGDPALRLAVALDSAGTRGPGGEWIAAAHPFGVGSAEKLLFFDIVEEWRALTRLPAVLAVWAAPRGSITAEVASDFLASRAMGLEHLEDISAAWSARLGLPAPALLRYLSVNIDYSLDRENLQGLEAFFSHAARLSLIPGTAALHLAAPAPGGKPVAPRA